MPACPTPAEDPRTIEAGRAERRERRRRELELLRGSIDYPEDYLDDLRADWPG